MDIGMIQTKGRPMKLVFPPEQVELEMVLVLAIIFIWVHQTIIGLQLNLVVMIFGIGD